VLFIIWGSTGRNVVVSRGDFHCPSCQSKQPYQHVEVKRYFTLYFIPLFPLETVGEYVECGSCKETYKRHVLQYDPEQEQREFRSELGAAVTMILVQMMLIDGDVDDAEIEAIRHIHQQLLQREIAPDEIRSEAVALRHSGAPVSESLTLIAPRLNEHGKEMVMRAACMVALADEVLRDEELALLVQYARALGLSEAHFKGILMTVREPA
jgi:uncharacterized tellurite resistance protein B-like protein